jgi:hypothetical protein
LSRTASPSQPYAYAVGPMHVADTCTLVSQAMATYHRAMSAIRPLASLLRHGSEACQPTHSVMQATWAMTLAFPITHRTITTCWATTSLASAATISMEVLMHQMLVRLTPRYTCTAPTITACTNVHSTRPLLQQVSMPLLDLVVTRATRLASRAWVSMA